MMGKQNGQIQRAILDIDSMISDSHHVDIENHDYFKFCVNLKSDIRYMNRY